MRRVQFLALIAIAFFAAVCLSSSEEEQMRMPNWSFIKGSSVRTLAAFTTPETEKDPKLLDVWHKMTFTSTAPIALQKIDCSIPHLTRGCFDGLFIFPKDFPHMRLFEGGYYLKYTGNMIYEEVEEWARSAVVPKDDVHKIKIPKADTSKVVKDKKVNL